MHAIIIKKEKSKGLISKGVDIKGVDLLEYSRLIMRMNCGNTKEVKILLSCNIFKIDSKVK